MGRLVVFEGIDGSGKSTQFDMLVERLGREGREFRRLRFPRYDSDSSALIRMYLGGEFGSSPSDVNPYAASTFYAVDRFASYASDWREAYEEGSIIITDRYTTSNAIHQGSKLRAEERDGFFRWLYDFEFRLMGLPRPDSVIYVDLPVGAAIESMRVRDARDGTSRDIHEKDAAYLNACRETGLHAAGVFGWHVIDSLAGGVRRTAEDIHNEIYNIIEKELFL